LTLSSISSRSGLFLNLGFNFWRSLIFEESFSWYSSMSFCSAISSLLRSHIRSGLKPDTSKNDSIDSISKLKKKWKRTAAYNTPVVLWTTNVFFQFFRKSGQKIGACVYPVKPDVTGFHFVVNNVLRDVIEIISWESSLALVFYSTESDLKELFNLQRSA